MYCKKKQKWIDREFNFVDSMALSKPDEKVLKKMNNSVLYRPFILGFLLLTCYGLKLMNKGRKIFLPLFE